MTKIVNRDEFNYRQYQKYMFLAYNTFKKAKIFRKNGNKEQFEACMSVFRSYSKTAKAYHDLSKHYAPEKLDTVIDI